MAAKPQVTLPREVHLSGLTWPVRVRVKVSHQNRPQDGLCRPKEQDILLTRDCTAHTARARRLLLHEILHGAMYDHPDYYEDEALVVLLENRLDEFIRLNPEFMEMYGYARQD